MKFILRHGERQDIRFKFVYYCLIKGRLLHQNSVKIVRDGVENSRNGWQMDFFVIIVDND